MEVDNHKINPEECLESIKIESSHQDLFKKEQRDEVDLKPPVNFRDKFINILMSYNNLQKRINTQNHKYSKQCHKIIDLQKKIKLLDGENQKNIYDLRNYKYINKNQEEKIFKLEQILIYFFCLLNLLVISRILY
jgi:hypothetical protein